MEGGKIYKSEIFDRLGIPLILCCCPCCICSIASGECASGAFYVCLVYRIIATMIFSFLAYHSGQLVLCPIIQLLIVISTFALLKYVEKVKEEKRAIVPKTKYKTGQEKGTQLIEVPDNDENV